jgi:thiamine-phosphate pyrophosphorylase
LFRVYLVTDRGGTRGRPLLEVVEAALRGGVEAVQLREKDLSTRALSELATSVQALCARHGRPLLINDRIDVALAVGADGVHLPVNSFAAADARRLLGAGRTIGVSAHSLAQALAAERGGADFVVFGPVFETPSKQAYGDPVGTAPLTEVVERLRIPVLAIGGLTPERVEAVRQCGAAGVAAISGILAADDPEAAARRYADAIASCEGPG